MSGPEAAARQFGQGPLSRAAALVYTLLAVELLLLATAAPGLVPMVLLARDASNIPLYAACALPAGPALSAAVYALHRHRPDLTDLAPVATFWRGYRLNLGGVLRLWLPWLAGMTVVAVGLGNAGATGLPGWWRALLVVIAALATLWMANALVITSLFVFRPVDVARLGLHFLGRTPAVALGNAGLVIIAAGVTYYSSEAVLTLLASPLVLALLRTCRPMLGHIEREFIA